MMHASEISAAISPYSIAVAPLWSRSSLVPRLFLVVRMLLSLFRRSGPGATIEGRGRDFPSEEA